MNIKEVRSNLNKKVRYTNPSVGVDGEYILNACIIRKNDKGVYCQAELQQPPNSVIVTGLESINVINGE